MHIVTVNDLCRKIKKLEQIENDLNTKYDEECDRINESNSSPSISILLLEASYAVKEYIEMLGKVNIDVGIDMYID